MRKKFHIHVETSIFSTDIVKFADFWTCCRSRRFSGSSNSFGSKFSMISQKILVFWNVRKEKLVGCRYGCRFRHCSSHSSDRNDADEFGCCSSRARRLRSNHSTAFLCFEVCRREYRTLYYVMLRIRALSTALLVPCIAD